MDLRSIRYFVQIADLGSITRASQHLGIAQPALSRHVRSIEEELGTQLLVRLPRGVRLTGAGLQFLDHCRRIVRELGRARDELRSTSEVPKGRVVLGLSPTTGPMLLPGVMERVRRQCPQVSLKVVEGFSSQLYDSLITGRVDLAVLTSPAPSRALRLLPLISEPIVVLTSPEPRGARRFYTLPELSRTPVFTTEAIRSIVDEQLARYGSRLSVEAEVDAVEAIRRLLLRGIGAAVMPLSTFHDDISAGRIAAFQIADATVHRFLMLGLQAERSIPAAVEEVSQVLTAETNHLFDMGLFSLPAAHVPQVSPAPAPQSAAARSPHSVPARRKRKPTKNERS
ncbi:MAG TPA: LysR family transcriptional regulator [Burkholderiales bacterium]|nr:LysR family transcriptional regulator [Burkholderiales bacterium]